MPAESSHPFPLLRLAAVLLAAALLLTGCGGSDDTNSRGASPVAAQSDPPPSDGVADTTSDDDPAAQDAAPTPAAIAAGRRFDALVSAYAPVSARINFLVTAETLRVHALDSGVDPAVERERFGAVRVEARRMQRVLGATRPKVAAVTVGSPRQQRVQALMLAAIDARARALRELEVALTALASESVPDSDAEALEERWRASWDASLRAAREATTTMQDAREELGLVPASEGAIR